MISVHPSRTLVRQDSGVCVLESERGPRWRLAPMREGWRVEGDDTPERWLLRAVRSRGSRFVLTVERDERELGRTLALEDAGHPPELRYFLMGDGALFRFALCGPRDWRFELSGRETPGTYLTARPQVDGWRIEASPASGGIEDLRALTVLFAAEILESEGPLGAGHSG